jgi:GAF domain-containing protein
VLGLSSRLHFDERYLDFCELVASQVTTAIANASELVAELTAMNRLHQLSTRLLREAELHPLLEEVLNATIALQSADFGNVQLYNQRTQTLEIVAQCGFGQEFLDHFSSVNESGAACGRALKRAERVIIEDVLTDPDFAPHRAIAASAGFRAVQSTPLFSRSGEPLGMISTHFRQPHRPSERELRLTDLSTLPRSFAVTRSAHSPGCGTTRR